MFIEDIINLLRENTGFDFVFDTTAKAENCIVYSYSPSTFDGVKGLYRLSLRIIQKGRGERTLLRIENIKKKLLSVLITPHDTALSSQILSVRQNGGGVMVDYDTDTTHEIIYFDILYKEV